MEPIESWKEIIDSDIPAREMCLRLREQVYRNHRPFVAEIIMNSRCPNRCLHCIYAPDYDRFNGNMSLEAWRRAFEVIHEKMGLRRFIFDGRALTRECVQAIGLIRRDFPDAEVGLIADGVSLRPLAAELVDSPPDWLDVSLDGLEVEHDAQRNQPGAFRTTMDTLIQLKESGAFAKINILTCLTTVNLRSVTGMMRQLNDLGFKNFFVTPVTIMKGCRPDPALQPNPHAFMKWLDELLETAPMLSDSWVELDIYDVLYAAVIRRSMPVLFQEFGMDYEHLNIRREYGDNEFHINYYPSSLTGVRELIVNSNGDIIPPKLVAMGEIPGRLVTGNVCDQDANGSFLDHRNGNNVLGVLFEELLEEKRLLGP